LAAIVTLLPPSPLLLLRLLFGLVEEAIEFGAVIEAPVEEEEDEYEEVCVAVVAEAFIALMLVWLVEVAHVVDSLVLVG
jgi:hypothetical protein